MDISKDPPERELKADKWTEMSLSDLYKQRDLLVEKIGTVSKLLSLDGSPQIHRIYEMMQYNLMRLNAIIEKKAGLSNSII